MFDAESGELVAGFKDAPIIIDHSTKEEIGHFENEGLSFYFGEDNAGILHTIHIKNTSYKLTGGIGLGSSQEDVIAQFGEPVRDHIVISKGGQMTVRMGGFLMYEWAIITVDKNKNVKSISLSSENDFI